jgi:putative endonuclease
MEEMFFVYILRSLVNGKLYIGYTSDIEARLNRHNNSQETYTKNGIPWELIYKEDYTTKGEAIKREKHLKNMKNPKYILEKIVKDDSSGGGAAR